MILESFWMGDINLAEQFLAAITKMETEEEDNLLCSYL